MMKYEISCMADFNKIPDDELESCLNEFKTAVIIDRRVRNLFKIMVKEAGIKDVNPEVEGGPLEGFTWINDDAHNGTIQIIIGQKK